VRCQLDEVKLILDIAIAARKSLLNELPENSVLYRCNPGPSSLVYGLLLLSGNDVFIQKGVVSMGDKELDHYWVLVYLDGDAFILDIAPTWYKDQLDVEVREDVLFMPEGEAAAEYGYAMGKDYEWRKEDCGENVWQAALEHLKIKKPLSQVFRDIEE